MNPNQKESGGASAFTYVSGGQKETPKPMKLGSSVGGNAFNSYTSKKTDLKTTEGLYELANQAGLGQQADKMIQRSGGESQKYMSGGFIMDAMDLLNTFSYGVVGLVKGKGFIDGVKNRETLSDEDALGKYGWQGKVAGFVGDILLDPLTYIAPVKIVSKIPGVTKAWKSGTEKVFGRLVEREVGAGAMDGLTAEARKYKSAEEFVKAQGNKTYYHTTSTDVAPLIEKDGFKPQIGERTMGTTQGNGVFFYEDVSPTVNFGKNFTWKGKEPTVVEAKINGKIYNSKSQSKSINALAEDTGLIEQLKADGFVGIRGTENGTPVTFVFNPSSVKTKSQLTDIWNQVKAEPTKLLKKAEEAKALGELETIRVSGQKTFKREGGWKPMMFLADKLVYGFAASKEFLGGVQKIAGRNEAILGDAEKLVRTISKLTPGIFDRTVMTGADGRMISTPLKDLEISMKREGLDAELESVREMYGLRDSLMNRLEELGVLTKETKEAHWNTYLKQSYDEFLESKNSFTGTKSGIGIDSKKRVEELTPEMMKELGQVQDGAVLWATTLLKQIDLVKKAELQKFTDEGYAMTTDMLAEYGRKGGKIEDLHQIPSDSKRYGALAGKYVSKEVWNVLKGSFEPTKELGEKYILAFKHLKVVWNPASHVRNAFSATIQNWWKLGMGPWRMDLYYQAQKEFRHGSPALKEMRDMGFSERSGYLSELMNNYLLNQNLIGKTVKQQLGNKKGWQKYAKHVDRALLNSYGHTDNVAKLAAYKFGLSKGLSKEDAYAQAMAATFNYSEITPFVHQMRRAIWGVPFITFALKAAPLTAKTLVNAPHRISVFGKARNDLFAAAGVEGEQEAEALPDYMRDDMFVMRLPWKDSEGRSMYFDLSYIIPFGSIADGSLLKNPVAANPVLQLVRELSTNETFGGKKIFRESDDIDTVLTDISVHVMKLGLPPPVTDFLSEGYKRDGTKAESKVGWERAAGINTSDFGAGERTYYQTAARMLGVGAVPYELNSKESSLAYTQKENLTKLLLENGVIKTFESPYLPKDSEFRPENQGLSAPTIYDKEARPIGR